MANRPSESVVVSIIDDEWSGGHCCRVHEVCGGTHLDRSVSGRRTVLVEDRCHEAVGRFFPRASSRKVLHGAA